MMNAGPLTAAAAALVVFLSACSGEKTPYYQLEGGDPEVDWIEFTAPDTILWIAPGRIPVKSAFEEDADGNIVVHVAPFSSGRMRRVDGRTLVGEAPFFEGTWKKVNIRR